MQCKNKIKLMNICSETVHMWRIKRIEKIFSLKERGGKTTFE